MKIPKEYTFIVIIGLFLLAYVLEAVVDPLRLKLATPYEFLNPTVFGKYPFSTATIFIRALSFFLVPTFLLSFIKDTYFFKFGSLLVVSSLAQLYSLQEVTSGTTLIPLEWSLSLSIAGLTLLIPTVFYLATGLYLKAKNKFTNTIDSLGDNSHLDENN